MKFLAYTFIIICLFFTSLLFFSLIRYRLFKGKELIIKRELVYQVIDLGQGAIFRTNIFEHLQNNKRIFTINKTGQTEWFYVSEDDYKKCWKNSSLNLKNNKTKLLTIKTRKLLFGGYAQSKIEKIEFLNKKPILRK